MTANIRWTDANFAQMTAGGCPMDGRAGGMMAGMVRTTV